MPKITPLPTHPATEWGGFTKPAIRGIARIQSGAKRGRDVVLQSDEVKAIDDFLRVFIPNDIPIEEGKNPIVPPSLN